MAFNPQTGRFEPDVPQTGLIGSEQAIRQGLTGGEQALRGGLETSLGALQQGLGTARQDIDPFAQQGMGAANIQAALTGALGPEQQAQAFQQFQQDPGTQFLQQQGEQSVLRNQAAIGGLGGGNVRRALTRFGQGLAGQGLQQRFQNLGDISQRGFQAAGQQADLARTGGLSAAELLTGAGRDVAGGRTRAGELLGAGRMQTGRDIASQIGGTTSALSDLISRQGAGLADITGAGGANLANLLQGAGAAQAGGQTDLATILANIATQQGTAAAGQPSAAQFLTGGGLLQPIGQLAGGIGTALQASDIRLKTNIQRTGQTPYGINLYTWDWTEEAKEIVGDQPTFGVMAQEVMEMTPDAVIMYPDGFYRVDYARIH